MHIRANILIGISKIKTMKKTNRHMPSLFRRLKTVPVLAAMVLMVVSGASAAIVHADDLQAQIDALNQQNAQKQGKVSGLQLQASSYQDAINRLQQQIASIQAAIAQSEAKQAQLQQQINADQAKLDQEKKVLGEDLKAMYVSGQMSSMEMLASSKNLSDFVDAETYGSAVQGKIQQTLDKITALQNSLEDQQNQVKALLASQQLQNQQLAADQQKQSALLAYNQSQQADYNAQIKANESKVTQLQAELAAQLASLGGTTRYGGTGGYPWSNAPCLDGPGSGPDCGNYDWGYPSGSSVPYGAPTGPWDPWAYEYRNCTSYVAWKINSISSAPNISSDLYGLGNAADWPSSVPGSWIDHRPRAHDAAVLGGVAGGQGHVMFVEAVNSNGTIDVSQYNVVPGAYSEQFNMDPSGLRFIHFPGT